MKTTVEHIFNVRRREKCGVLLLARVRACVRMPELLWRRVSPSSKASILVFAMMARTHTLHAIYAEHSYSTPVYNVIPLSYLLWSALYSLIFTSRARRSLHLNFILNDKTKPSAYCFMRCAFVLYQFCLLFVLAAHIASIPH